MKACGSENFKSGLKKHLQVSFFKIIRGASKISWSAMRSKFLGVKRLLKGSEKSLRIQRSFQSREIFGGKSVKKF
jgi:hypothetical protein